MKYAIFSDIHGNHHALQAALTDAKQHGATRHFFLGDYFRECPTHNEVAETISTLENATVIRGNNEGYLKDIYERGQNEYWSLEQFKLIYWNYQTLKPENLDYLISLPDAATLDDGNTSIHLAHTANAFFPTDNIKLLSCNNFRDIMQATPFTHTQYLQMTKAEILACPDASAAITTLPKGVYLFGHNHMQFHMVHEEKTFINPGSCGVPLDFDTTAPYTILELTPTGYQITERRVKYDIAATIASMRESELATYAPFWNNLMIRHIQTATESIMPFLIYLQDTAKQQNKPSWPASNEIWDLAVNSWDIENQTATR
jgi:predicted phosphodiesterase